MLKSRIKIGWQAEAPARPSFGRPHNNSSPKWKKRRRNTEFRIQNSQDASEERKLEAEPGGARELTGV